MIKKITPYLLVFCLTTYFSYNFTINYFPNLVYEVLHYKLQNNQNINDNELKYYDLPNTKSNDVVMPNPDFMYVVSFYDLSDGALNLTAKMPDSTYWSVSFYKTNTVNWYVKNDKEFNTNQLNLVLSKQKDSYDQNMLNIIESPEEKGIMIIRILVEKKDKESIAYYKSYQKSVEFNKIF